WIAAVVFIPYLGSLLLPDLAHRAHAGSELSIRTRLFSFLRLRGKAGMGASDPTPLETSPTAAPTEPPAIAHDPYQSAFYLRFREMVSWCVRFRKTVIAITVATFLASLFLFQYVPQQFFPDSTRLELMVDIKLAEGASLKATTAQVSKLETMLKGHPGLKNYVAYVGTGSPRFYLPLDQQLPATSFAQFVLLTDDIKSREEIRKWLIDTFATKFTDVQARVTRLENGPPVGYPVQFRISGEHIDQVRKLALEVAAKVRQNPDVTNVNLDWQEPSKAVRLIVDQDRARALGVSSAQLSGFLRNALSGGHVSYYREGKELIEVLLRGPQDERERLSLLGSLSVPSSNGTNVPLSQIATLAYGFEEGIIWHRNRLPTVTVRADIYGKATPPSVAAQIEPTLASIRAELPAGYLLQTGGTVEDSARGQASVNAGLPLFIFVVTTLLMIQLRSFSRVAMVWLTAPLGLIGVSLFLVVLRVPFGFVAMLGTIALFGMIMRNSVILVDQIEQDIAAGHDQWTAIIDATVRRFRPIVLTALAALLAMIPLSRSVFFGPMAVAIMGGLFVGTALTLLFLPALYAAWFRVKPVEHL
ncbi:MAG: efflux RND transporter permease subunit, partial [Lysobacteraceae bacterium]